MLCVDVPRPLPRRAIPPSWVGGSGGIQRPSLFEWQVGAHDVPFEACSGFTRIAARRLADPPVVGPCPESFSDSVALLAASVATGTYRHFPGQDFHLLETRPLYGAHSNPCFSLERAVAPRVTTRTYDVVATGGCHGVFEFA